MKKYSIINLAIVSIITVLLIGFCSILISNKISAKRINKQYYNFTDLDMDKADICLKYENNIIKLGLPVYVKNNRYYLPITDIINKLHGKSLIKNNNIYLKLDKYNVILDIRNCSFNVDGKENKLKQNIIVNKDVIYLSLFDYIKIFDLKTYWDVNNKTICFYKNREKFSFSQENKDGKLALIRLEDITAGGTYKSVESLEKLRIVSDYLYEEKIPFHIAWIPRYINPSLNIDNDPSEMYSMYNADFIFTMDYLIDRNGIIGLHGYTHQYGNTESVEGIEFHRNKYDNIPYDKEYAQDRVNKALEISKKLDFKCAFFEAPHYAILPNQLEVIEKNFKYIYEPYSKDGGVTESKYVFRNNSTGKSIIYIPTPLNYIDGKSDCDNMITRIHNLNRNFIASFFYHPYIEFSDIKTYREKDGYPSYDYDKKSVLHKIINKFKDDKYKFCTINEMN